MTPTVIVFEKRLRWAPELQRQFVGEEVEVRSCRSTADVLLMLERAPRNVIVFDLEAAVAECLQFLGRLMRRGRSFSVVVIGSKRTAELEWPVRELGAVEVRIDSPTGEELADLCRRQLMCTSQTGGDGTVQVTFPFSSSF